MLNAPLSWLITLLLILFICSIFCFQPRQTRRRWTRRLFRRRSHSPPFWFHLPPIHLAGSGLDAASIAALPIESFAALKLITDGRVPSDCAVCQDTFEDSETLRFIPKCLHAFHVSCLDPWLVAHTTCPTCRASLVQLAPDSTRSNDVVLEVAENLTLATSPQAIWSQFWKHKSPLRLKVLVCRVLSGAMPLSHRRLCAMCGGEGETPEHLFFRCAVARALWYEFWGIRTDGEVTGEWTTANWVEASLFPNRLLAFDLEEEGEMFLFLSCLIDKIWAFRNRVLNGEEDEVSLERVKMAVEDSFRELRSAFCIQKSQIQVDQN